ncbi:hypothetical protein RvY_07778 [Ramazzottius varieornatus]|uniref:Uncharacterized protein n=1 Tax=Ramazzottius varieornatus TaxID=947166 RepID=A0A1D1V3F4_RAMVA|nr:hypothetical protein RvY_07778 [Ramazzottius varieornatus]
MSSSATSPPGSPPPPYREDSGARITFSLGKVGGLISVDFIPGCTRAGGFVHGPEFEGFPVVLQRANQWLQSSGHLEIRTCETVEFNTKSNGQITNLVESITTVAGETANRYVRALRLWMQPRSDGAVIVQQIGYYNILPSVSVGWVSASASERLDTLIAKTNTLFMTNPIQGRIITIETVTLKVKNGTTQPDVTAWTERGGVNEYYAHMLRIFFVMGPPAYETIGMADFVPGVLNEGSLFSRPKVETFPAVLGKVSSWLMQQQPLGFRLTNVQTLLYKQKWTTHMDTLKMLYAEGEIHNYYVRYLRLAFVISNNAAMQSTAPNVRLTCKLFVPGMLQPPGCCHAGSYENQLQLRQRMDDWMKATAARIVAVETIQMRVFSGAENTEGFDTMHTWNLVTTHVQQGGRGHGHGGGFHEGHHGGHAHGHHGGYAHGHHHHTTTHHHKASERYLTLYRAYLDGFYSEPPGFPQLPSVEEYMRANASSCTIM